MLGVTREKFDILGTFFALYLRFAAKRQLAPLTLTCARQYTGSHMKRNPKKTNTKVSMPQ